MPYTPQTWLDDDEASPLSAARLNYIESGIQTAQAAAEAGGGGGSVVDATTTVKGVVQLAGDLAGTANSPTVPSAVKTTAVDQTILGNKTFSNPVTGATPTTNAHLTTKQYVDTAVATGTVADATAGTKGIIQLAGDLAGTAASPTVPLAVKTSAVDQTILGNKTFSNPVIVATPTATTHATTKTYVDTADALKAPLASPVFTGTPVATTALTSDSSTRIATTAFVKTFVFDYTQLPPGSLAGIIHWSGATPVRPSTRTDIYFDWEGPMPDPPIVTSGTAGMYEGDRRSRTAF